jgi:hypothetical protein
MRTIEKKLKRLKVSSFILGVLVLIYFTTRLAANLAVFHPVQTLANTDLDVRYIDHKVEVVKEVEVDRKFQTEKQQIMAYIVEKFGDRSSDAITIINQCENHAFNTKAINHNSNGTVDRGIFQINSIHGGEEMFDWKQNVDMAYKIYHSQGDKFTAWTCATVIKEKNYLGQ